MVIYLKVLVRSFNRESCVCYVGNPRDFFFRICESKILFCEIFAKIGCYNIKGLLPTAVRGPAGKGHQKMWVAVAKFPKVTLRANYQGPWFSLFLVLVNMGPAKDKHGICESFAKVIFLYAKNDRFGIKVF